MKREYIGMLFLSAFVILYFIVSYFLGENIFTEYFSRYCVVWIFVAYTIGQYSMKYPKSF